VGLVELLKRHEGKTLEYKRDLSSPESVLKYLVAFANTGGGIVVIGVEDGSKNVRGVPDVLAAEEKIANLVSDSIRPRLVPDIEVVPWRNLNVLAVQVYPSNTRPHYLERLRPQDGVFIPVGSTNRKADAPQGEPVLAEKKQSSDSRHLTALVLRDDAQSGPMPGRSFACKAQTTRKQLGSRWLPT
jgi:predicted HTH transcriptional regulator